MNELIPLLIRFIRSARKMIIVFEENVVGVGGNLIMMKIGNGRRVFLERNRKPVAQHAFLGGQFGFKPTSSSSSSSPENGTLFKSIPLLKEPLILLLKKGTDDICPTLSCVLLAQVIMTRHLTGFT